MQILHEGSKPYILDKLTAPIGVSHFWSFSGHMLDFKLEELSYLEETVGPAVKVRAKNLEFYVPSGWYVLALDKETYQVDSMPITACATHDHNILMFSPDDSSPVTTEVAVIDYVQKMNLVHPSIPKGSMMIHPTGPETKHGTSIFYGLVMGPHDLWRWVGGKTIGDILT